MPASAIWAASVASSTGATISVTRPMRKLPSAPSTTAGRSILLGRQQSREERGVEGRILVDEAEVAGLLLARIGGHGLGDGLPVLAGLQVGERLVGLGPGGGDGLLGRLRRAVGQLGRHLDHPRTAELGRRGLLGERGVDVGGRDGHALGDGQLGLDGAVDELLERERVDLLQALVEEGVPALGVGGADLASGEQGADPALLVVGAELVDRHLLAPGVLGDRLAVDRCRGGQVVVVPGGSPGDEQEQEGGDDGESEADVEQRRASVAVIPGSGPRRGPGA